MQTCTLLQKLCQRVAVDGGTCLALSAVRAYYNGDALLYIGVDILLQFIVKHATSVTEKLRTYVRSFFSISVTFS